MNNKKVLNIAGWVVFSIAFIVYFMSAERTGSLWDCGEFILGAHKLQVVHPPGAPLFLITGRLFTFIAEMVSSNPEHIAFSVNIMSALCSAFAAMFVCWVTMRLGKLTLADREETVDLSESIALAASGIVAGLATAFATSVWFSAVEGEVYAMSTFFTTLTLWSMVKWYTLPDSPMTDRWLLFTFYAAGLSIGVHLLSILTFPALALFFYFKKYKNPNLLGILAAGGVGIVTIVAIQKLVITGIPNLWYGFDLFMVNYMGLPFHSGLIPTLLIVVAAIFFGLRYAHAKRNHLLQHIFVAASLVVIGFSTIGVVVIRANAETPVNMNDPSDASRLLPYLNREQYGERPLLRGPHFEPKGPRDYDITDRYGRLGDRYEIVDRKIDVKYDPADLMFFPRLGDNTQGRPRLYKKWLGLNMDQPLPRGRPHLGDNLSFLFNYQIGWMYWRYFMWNFAGRQNGNQGYFYLDQSDGNWLSGIPFIDNARLGNQSQITETMANNKARNKYYMLPFIFGLIGLFFHFKRRPNDALGLLAMFIITGIGIIIYSNQPPQEPRERDYVLVGSFFTYCIWIGFAVLSLFRFFANQAKMSGPVSASVAGAIILSAPLLMGFQNFDDHDRSEHKGSRDYASNFLQSCAPNSIVFTYGDNDTYPLWYAQEVEGIRTDVRVVNLSLIAVDWYIELLRRKVNDSDPIKMTIPQEAYRGFKRNQIPILTAQEGKQEAIYPLDAFLKFIARDNSASTSGQFHGIAPTSKVYIPVDSVRAIRSGLVKPEDANKIVKNIPLKLPQAGSYMFKDGLAILDVINSNIWDRPIYFAVTCRPEKFYGLQDYTQLEGLALRIVPIKGNSQTEYFGVVGSGGVNKEVLYDNVMNKFRWGNFDQKDLFIDRSYAPSVQSTKFAIRRAAYEFLASGDTTKAIDLADKHFEAFPHMNFPYDYSTSLMISIYNQANAYDKAKPHIEILAKEMLENLQFFDSLDPNDFGSYAQDQQFTIQTVQNILSQVLSGGDEAFFEKLQKDFGPYLNNETPTIDTELLN